MSQDSGEHPIVSHVLGFLASVPIEHLSLPPRARNPLLRAGLKTALDIQRLMERDTLSSVYNVGPTTFLEIEECLNSLLRDNGFSFPINKIALPEHDEVITSVVPTIFFDEMPVELLTEELGSELIHRLRSAGFERLGSLLDLSRVITTFIENASISLDRLINHQKDILQVKIAGGRLHSDAQYRNMGIQAWLNLVPESPDEQLELLKLLTQANEINSLTEELSLLFADLDERNLNLYVKYFNDNLTLEQVGKQQGLTRERVRQIASKVATKLWMRVDKNPGLYFQSALILAKDMGNHLSLKSWELELQKKGLIDKRPIRDNLNSFSALCALLRSISKTKNPPTIKVDDSIIFILESPGDLALGVIKAIESMPSKAKREVNRKISYIGGIHIAEASEIFDTPPQQTTYILKHLGYREVIPDWYTIAPGEYTVTRWPILKAGLAMMEVCGPLEFSSFCAGIRRYISRFYDVLAPPKVMKAHIEVLGFELEDDYVCWNETPSGYLAESDECFVQVVEKYGTVVTFQEIVEFFQEKGFSIATATARVLPQSPIVEKVETGLYKIRGQSHTWEDTEDARNRQEPIDYDPEVVYGIDGIIRYRITIGSWALNGALSISSNQQPLPDLGEGWEVLVENNLCGIAKRDEHLIWGLGSAFNALGLQIGDRVELAFDAWEKPVIRITKV